MPGGGEVVRAITGAEHRRVHGTPQRGEQRATPAGKRSTAGSAASRRSPERWSTAGPRRSPRRTASGGVSLTPRHARRRWSDAVRRRCACLRGETASRTRVSIGVPSTRASAVGTPERRAAPRRPARSRPNLIVAIMLWTTRGENVAFRLGSRPCRPGCSERSWPEPSRSRPRRTWRGSRRTVADRDDSSWWRGTTPTKRRSAITAVIGPFWAPVRLRPPPRYPAFSRRLRRLCVARRS